MRTMSKSWSWSSFSSSSSNLKLAIQVDPTSSNLASAMLNSKIRPRAVVEYGVEIFHPSPPNYVTRSPGLEDRRIDDDSARFKFFLIF